MQPGVQKNERDYLNGGLTPLMVAVKHKHVEATRKMVKFRWEWTHAHNLYQTCSDIRDVDLDPLDTDGHSLEFLVKRVDSSRYQIIISRKN